ncbi:hypothetical protein GCM10011386_27080 [Parapedobacter defluvii]|uniref:Phage/plasmid-like protein TIGR03299 n=1 Tax=Parapedobacter defluvii TaxID=2045106 RepID=A0ABQ1M279_9SPHI|nr:DUF932 domain-containing protein [Parapedobacter defluvii]GGC33542.1 hypothetical protein GCM10011386_27080 [Parapedobacter defluvii]
MADNINYNERTGKHSFFSVREKAWHGLGQIVEDYPTSEEAIKFAGLDYTVEKRYLFTYGDDTGPDTEDNDCVMEWRIDIPDYYATLRTDTDQVLGVVGKDYEIVQNTEAFNFFDSLVGGKGGIKYETAGALGRGEKIFITAKLPDFLRVGKADLIEQYLLLTTSHDGYGCITAAFTPIRVVCNNTLNAALRSTTKCVRIRHTVNAIDRLREAHKLLGITHRLAEDLEEVFNRWSKVHISDPAVKRLIQVAMVPNRETLQALQNGNYDALSTQYNNMVESAFEYAMSDPTQQDESTRGTLYGAFNGVTGYFQNVRNYRNEEAKFKSIMGGTALQRSGKAFELCSDFARFGNEALALN